jgi:dolichyl-phosphate-mannose-protein mannosyltransferase
MRSLHVARFGVLLLVGLLIRLLLVNVPGHSGDTSIMVGWAEYLAANGGSGFYRDGGSIYPALLYVLWPLGAWLDDPQLGVALKGLSIPFDLAMATLLALITGRLVSTRAAYGAAALYLFNPAVLLAGPVWGQVDAAGTLVFVAALVAAARERHATGGALAVVAGLLKPQFGLVLLPVLTVAVCARFASGAPCPSCEPWWRRRAPTRWWPCRSGSTRFATWKSCGGQSSTCP